MMSSTRGERFQIGIRTRRGLRGRTRCFGGLPNFWRPENCGWTGPKRVSNEGNSFVCLQCDREFLDVVKVGFAEWNIDALEEVGAIWFLQEGVGLKRAERKVGSIYEVFAEMVLAFFAHQLPGGREVCECGPDLGGGFGRKAIDHFGNLRSEVLEDREFVAMRENGPGKLVAFADEGIELLGAVEVGESGASFAPPLEQNRCGPSDENSSVGRKIQRSFV